MEVGPVFEALAMAGVEVDLGSFGADEFESGVDASGATGGDEPGGDGDRAAGAAEGAEDKGGAGHGFDCVDGAAELIERGDDEIEHGDVAVLGFARGDGEFGGDIDEGAVPLATPGAAAEPDVVGNFLGHDFATGEGPGVELGEPAMGEEEPEGDLAAFAEEHGIADGVDGGDEEPGTGGPPGPPAGEAEDGGTGEIKQSEFVAGSADGGRTGRDEPKAEEADPKAGGEVDEMMLIGREGGEGGEGEPGGDPAGAVAGGEDDGEADVERGGLVVRQVEAVELGEEPAEAAADGGDGEGEFEREEEEADERDELGGEEAEAVLVEFFFRGWEEEGGGVEEVRGPIRNDGPGEERDVMFPREDEAADGFAEAGDPVGEAVA